MVKPQLIPTNTATVQNRQLISVDKEESELWHAPEEVVKYAATEEYNQKAAELFCDLATLHSSTHPQRIESTLNIIHNNQMVKVTKASIGR